MDPLNTGPPAPRGPADEPPAENGRVRVVLAEAARARDAGPPPELPYQVPGLS